MESVDAKLSAPSDRIFTTSRVVTFIGSVLVALSSGTHYTYSAYAPQLGARLGLSYTQLNIIGLAGITGVSIFGSVSGRIVDRKGPQIMFIGASICFLVGYLGIKKMYDDGIGDDATVSVLHVALLIACSFVAGVGVNAGFGAAINATAKSFPSSVRATTTALVVSGFGLSAFWYSLIARTLFPGDTSAFLSLLALGAAIPMFIALFIVKPISLPPTSYNTRHEIAIEGYDPIPSGDTVVFVEELQETSDSEVVAEVVVDSTPLLSHEQEQISDQVTVPPSAVRSNLSVGSHYERSVGDKDGLPDIYGKKLLLTLDFYIVFVIMGICSGVGLMYINNVGSIAQALYAATHTVYDDVEASKWQATQVSVLSLGSFVGRALIGLISDFTYTRIRIPRAYCLCLVSVLFIISQATAIAVSSVETLWVATTLLGLAYGSLYGVFPTIIIEWFGLGHFSENYGYVCFSPIFGGNIFSLVFGRNLDAHMRVQGTLGARVWSSTSLVSRELPSERQCFDGKACYLGSLQATLVACLVSLGLSWWAGIRDEQMKRGRNAGVRR